MGLVNLAGLHVTLEKILHDYDLLATMREMNVSSGRTTLSDLPELSMEEEEKYSHLKEADGIQTSQNQTSHVDNCHEAETVSSSKGELISKFVSGNHAITA
jgi:hypothetical protein